MLIIILTRVICMIRKKIIYLPYPSNLEAYFIKKNHYNLRFKNFNIYLKKLLIL